MESFINSFQTDPLLLLKERIIKTDTLLDKYASISRKFHDLEKSHSQAVENEKRAKKDAIKFLEKYCKLAKKSNCLLNKIKTLEDDIRIKSNELKESQDECAKLESVVQVYKTERKGHQCLKKDKDFLLTTLWKILKRLDEEPKGYKSKKITETFFKKFERELTDLKLEDFRYNKVKNVSRLREKEVSEFLFSPESQVFGSAESDFIDIDIAPESVKSSFEESDENCVLENTKYMDSNHRPLDMEHKSEMETAEVNILENQDFSASDLSSAAGQNFEESVDSVPLGKNILKDCLEKHTSENNDFNCRNREEEGSLNVTSINISTEESIISGTEMRSNVQDQIESCQNYPNLKDKLSPLESEDKRGKEELRKTPEKFRKTYCRRTFQPSGHHQKIMKKIIADNCPVTNTNCPARGAGLILDLINSFESHNIDTFNVSSETISLDTDVITGNIGSIPNYFEYRIEIYDFLKSYDTKEENFSEGDSYLLFSTNDELVDQLGEVNSDTKNAGISKSNKFTSLFDVDDNGSSTPSGRVHDKELEDTCVEFSSNNGNTNNVTEIQSRRWQGMEKYDFILQNEILRNTENENYINRESQKIYNSGLKEIYIDCNSDHLGDGAIKNNISDSEFTGKEKDISDEEVYKILKEYKRVPLLSPIKEEVPNKRRKLFLQQSQKHDKCNVSQNSKITDSLKSMESFVEVLHNKPNGEELVFNTKTKKEEKMVDKLMQTNDKVVLGKHEMEQQSNIESKAVVYPKTCVRKVCKLVWKKMLKKFKNLKKCGRLCNLSCLDCMKKLLEIIYHSGIYGRNRTEISRFLNRRMSQRTSSLQFCKQKVSSWQVEDVEETNTISKNEPLPNCPDAEDCNFITQAPTEYLSEDRPNESMVKSEEMQSQKNVLSYNLAVSNQQVEFGQPTRAPEFYGNTCAYNVDREREFGSDIALQRCHPNDTANNFEKKNDSTEAHDITKNVENTLKSNLENIPEKYGTWPDALENKTDNLEKCVGGKQVEFQSGKACSKTEKPVMVSRRSSQSLSRNNPVMEENKRTNGHSLTRKESHHLMKVDISEGSLPSANGTSMERHERYLNESINDSVPIKEVPEQPISSTLKSKFEELFGETDSQSDCSSKSGGDLTHIKVQKEVSGNLKSNKNSGTSGTVAIRKKRRICPAKSKAGRTYSKKIKWELLSVCSENSDESPPKNDVCSGDTFSSKEIGTGDSKDILDSILFAMTKQKDFFKDKPPCKGTEVSGANYRNICPAQPSQPTSCISSISVHQKISNEYQMKGNNTALLNLPYYWTVGNQFGKQAVPEKQGRSYYDVNHSEDAKLKPFVEREIRNFLKVNINSVEEGEEKVKSCIAVLRRASESLIANTIVNEIMANVDEQLKQFERPAPPLTQTQHRIMIILRVFSLSDEQFHRISDQILKIIRSKIFPERFFWPDDSLEMASRFYAALCRRLNDFKGIWKFCFQVITCMRQRWCIPILVVLQVWPDIIHNANYAQNNLLVRAFANIILHAPISIGMRRKRQEQKLLAVKHLLINFYNFDANSTIEDFTKKLWELLVSNTSGSVDALVLISKCRTWSWTTQNVIIKIIQILESWMKGEISGIIVSEVLDILLQITIVFPVADSAEASSAKDVISVLSKVLEVERLNPMSKEKIIRILCDLSHYSDGRDVLLRILAKLSTFEPLYGFVQRALSSKKRIYEATCKKANTKIKQTQRRYIKPKTNTNSSLQTSVLDSTNSIRQTSVLDSTNSIRQTSVLDSTNSIRQTSVLDSTNSSGQTSVLDNTNSSGQTSVLDSTNSSRQTSVLDSKNSSGQTSVLDSTNSSRQTSVLDNANAQESNTKYN